jgi:tetratricopeptide (TPR) repeat protein
MIKKSKKPTNLWQELKRRNVPRTLAIYAGTAFIILEAADIIFPRWGLPDWSVDLILYLLILGAIITVIISWIYDITPGGIVKTDKVDEKEVISAKPKGKLNTSNIIIAVLIIVVGVLLYPKIFKNDSSPLSGTSRSTIAVIPLKIIGDESEVNYFASGLVESMTYILSKIGNAENSFSVIPASEILETISADEARKQYGASMIISGSIQMEKEKTRLILNLVDTKKQHVLGSEKLDYEKDNNFLIQDEAILLMTQMLGLQLESKTKSLLNAGHTNSAQANELYLQGLGNLRNAQSLKEINNAIDFFRQAIIIDTSFALAHSGLGEAYWEKYNKTKDIEWANLSLAHSKRAISLNDGDASSQISLGIILSAKGDYDSALIAFHKALELEPNNDQGYMQAGNVFRRLGQVEKAEQYYIKAINLKPDYWRCYNYLGVLYYLEGNYEEAVNQFNKGLELAPGNQSLLNNLAGSYWNLHQLENAIETYEKILKINPVNANAIANLGTCNFYLGNFDMAIYYYEKDLAIRPKDFRILGWLADSYYWSNDKINAYKYYDKAIKLAKENMEFESGTLTSLAYYYGMLEEVDSARIYLYRANIPKDPEQADTYTALNCAENYLVIGDTSLAFKWMESALKREYGWIQVKYHPMYKDLYNVEEFNEMIAKYKPPNN